jgi:hypothetical protein
MGHLDINKANKSAKEVRATLAPEHGYSAVSENFVKELSEN